MQAKRVLALALLTASLASPPRASGIRTIATPLDTPMPSLRVEDMPRVRGLGQEWWSVSDGAAHGRADSAGYVPAINLGGELPIRAQRSWDHTNPASGEALPSPDSLRGDGRFWGGYRPAGQAPQPLILTFADPLQSFGLAALHDNTSGGAVVDTTWPVLIEAFAGPDATGVLLGTVLASGASPPIVAAPVLSFAGLAADMPVIRSVRIQGSGPTQGLLLDYVTVQVPEPASFAAFATLAGLAARRIRRGRACTNRAGV
jgi:hypothetical protein